MIPFIIELDTTEGMREGMGLSINDVDEVFVILEVIDNSMIMVCPIEQYADSMPSNRIH